MTTEYYPQENEPAESFNRTIVFRLRHYVAENRKDWFEFVLPLPYKYEAQVNLAAKILNLSLVLTRKPPDPPLYAS